MPLHITVGGGKMEGIRSLNTNPLENEFCKSMRKTESICSKCYSAWFLEHVYKHTCVKPWSENGELLSTKTLKEIGTPWVYDDIFRFHSHGELINELHAKNFTEIAKKNRNTLFVLWTKRPNLLPEKLPKNFRVIKSNSQIDNPINEVPLGFHGVFNVFTKEYANKNQIDINCEGKCRECMRCYDGKNSAGVINEIIKKR